MLFAGFQLLIILAVWY